MYHYLRLRLYRYLLFAGLFLAFPPCVGQVPFPVRTTADSLYRHISRGMSDKVSCHFTYAQGSSTIFPGLGNNAAELEKLNAFVAQALSYSNLSISRIRLTGYCSIEGSSARNEALSYERVEGFYRYLHEHYPRLSRYPYDQTWVGEDWVGLSERIKASRIGEREEVLEIIRRVRSYDTREALLAKLNGGRPWLFMEREIFPQLRRVELRIEYAKAEAPKAHEPKAHEPKASPRPSPKERGKDYAASRQALAASPRPFPNNGRRESTNGRREPKERGKDATWSSPPQYFVSSKKKDSLRKKDAAWSSPLSFGEGRGEAAFRFALKTNLLLAAGIFPDFSYTAPVANVALEYFIDERWSVEAGAAYSYWHYNSGKEFQGVSGYRLEPRYRLAFPGDRFGAYLGLYGRVGDYDSRTVDPDGDGVQSTLNYTGDYWDAGVSGGFTLRLVGNLGLEIGVRGGYVSTSPNEYTRNGGRNRFESRWKYNKVGVTDINLSFIYNFQ